MRKQWIIAGVLVLLTGSAFAANPVAERRASFKNFKRTMAPMGKMLNGGSYDPAQFALMAKQLDTLSSQPWQYFPAGSSSTDTKAEIWSKPAEFKKAAADYQAATGKLNQLAHGGDVNQVRAQFRLVQKSCKACHDSFRS